MKNPYLTAADFWQERDFGTKISAVFEFLGRHWRPLGKCLLYFVLPPMLLLSIGLGQAPDAFAGLPRSANSVFAQLDAGSLTMLGGVLPFTLLASCLFGYLRARLRLPAAAPVTPAAVWAELRARLGRMALAVGLMLAGYAGLALASLAATALLAGSSLYDLFFWTTLFIGPLGAYLVVALSLYLPVLWLEDAGVLGSLSRCFQLIKGSWWSTFGLLLVSGLLQVMLASVFAVFRYLFFVGEALKLPGLNADVLGVVVESISTVGYTFTHCIPLLALAFQYFTLAERREGHGLRLLVDQLGQPQGAPVAYSAHYRPDEEGEY